MAAELRFNSRRSVVISSNGSVACSQPLASQIGLDILKRGGNAADAAVAVAAALNVTEPCSTGIGGDAFCLFYDAKTKSVKGLNGSGRAPTGLSLELLSEQGFTPSNPFPQRHAHSVTVPGAAAAWVDTLHKFGSNKLSIGDILQPAINLAETGFPVQECVADSWAKSADLFKDPKNIHGRDLLLDGEAPKHGQIMKMPHLAQTFKEVAANGKQGFYTGRIAKAIVNTVQQHGGCMTLDDLATHVTTFDEPISVAYHGCRVWEMPPNGQGIVALQALNILKGFNFKEMKPNSVEYLHLLIESLRLSFADGQWYCADPTKESVPITDLLSDQYAAERRKLIDVSRAQADVVNGSPVMSSDTVYFTVADKDGNACSFINSNYMGFGTGLVPEGCGFTLQNRGCGFSLDPSHPNRLAPGKRPYHTIIPGMVTSSETGDLMCSFGVMGGFMQPQGHVQVLMNMIEFGMNPQQALDQPRFCIGIADDSRGNIFLEDGISLDVMEKLRLKGHNVIGPICGWDRILFGRGQIISKGSWWREDGRGNSVYWSGSDSRADGQVAAY